MKLVTTGEMAQIDLDAQDRFHIPGVVLMEGAAIRCFDILERRVRNTAGHEASVVFAVGKGNNGGDALAMARHAKIHTAFHVHIVMSVPDPGGVCGDQLRTCLGLGIPMTVFSESPDAASRLFADADWIVDGLSGTGIRGSLREPLAALAGAVNAAGTPVFSVDTPSGIGDEFRKEFPAVRASVTAAIGLPKACLYLPHARGLCGEIVHVPISFPTELTRSPQIAGELDTTDDLTALLAPIERGTYKNRRGYVAVFGGTRGTAGAAVLAATAAARSRTGLVSLYVEDAIYEVAAAQCRAVMVRPWNAADDPRDVLPGPCSAFLAGPGWGQDADRVRWIRAMVDTGLPGVLDADALSLVAAAPPEERRELGFSGKWVFTPHPGEFARLCGRTRDEVLDEPFRLSSELAREFDAVIVLKGHVVTVAAPDGRYWVVDGMNPAMATGGSGDILGGIVSGLLASGLDAADAARAGVLLHQAAGRKAYDERGWFISDDLLDYLSPVLGHYQRLE